ncbi:IS66 family insertion sequence element accessory protein TnpB [Clostridium vitabionis]|jgi:transposase|uniref:IS66 family insertion sequence element accessory protein TnpB n=1 Tax=Clostridium vitabionis TaxID=2784388 RepID=UPI00188B8310|nr:IS66 family insertion sequence element accessory protein TnpB [Clostridium vitabionis]
MLGDLSGVRSIYIVTGYTDMRKQIDGLAALVQHTFSLDPYANNLYLFCGRRCDRIKALHYEPTGFVLFYKRLNVENGRFQWPRTEKEAKLITRKQFSYLMDGLDIEQPKAMIPGQKKDF